MSEVGLEPTCLTAADFKSVASAYSAIRTINQKEAAVFYGVPFLNVSHKRPVFREKQKQHGVCKAVWKGSANMGMVASLLMAGTGVHRAERIT